MSAPVYNKIADHICNEIKEKDAAIAALEARVRELEGALRTVQNALVARNASGDQLPDLIRAALNPGGSNADR